MQLRLDGGSCIIMEKNMKDIKNDDQETGVAGGVRCTRLTKHHTVPGR